MSGLKDLDQMLTEVKSLELKLFRLVLTSFAFSLLAVLAQYDKFDIAFKALTEITGGVMGAAGVLSAYLSDIRHPADEKEALLWARPKVFGLRFSITFTAVTAMFYLFYYYASRSSQFCLVFLSAGVFLLFRGLGRSILIIKQSEKQNLLWDSFSADEQQELLAREREWEQRRDDAVRNSNKVIREVNLQTKEAEAKHQERIRARRYAKIKLVFKNLWNWTYKPRSRISENWLVSGEEKLRRAVSEVNVVENLRNSDIEQIIQGKIPSLKLEGSGIKLFQGSWNKYFLLEGTVTEAVASHHIKSLEQFKDAKGHFNDLVAIISSGSEITYQASELLSSAGIYLSRTDQNGVTS